MKRFLAACFPPLVALLVFTTTVEAAPVCASSGQAVVKPGATVNLTLVCQVAETVPPTFTASISPFGGGTGTLGAVTLLPSIEGVRVVGYKNGSSFGSRLVNVAIATVPFTPDAGVTEAQ